MPLQTDLNIYMKFLEIFVAHCERKSRRMLRLPAWLPHSCNFSFSPAVNAQQQYILPEKSQRPGEFGLIQRCGVNALNPNTEHTIASVFALRVEYLWSDLEQLPTCPRIASKTTTNIPLGTEISAKKRTFGRKGSFEHKRQIGHL